MPEPSLFHSAITDEKKKKNFEEVVFYIKLWNVARISCHIIRNVFRNIEYRKDGWETFL